MREQVARVLGASATKLDPERPLPALGLDSLMGVELKNRVERDLAFSLPMGELMHSATVQSLAMALLDQLATSAPVPAMPAVLRHDTAGAWSTAVEQLSDAEVDSLLHTLVDEEASDLIEPEGTITG